VRQCAATIAIALLSNLAVSAARAQAAAPVAGAVAAAPPGATSVSRPKIGLVLSGGGARGLTHLGVIKVLEELRVPVDYIAATSMGAIVGGLYASGLSPADMEKQLTAISWPTLFSDSPPRSDLGFRRKQEDALYPLAFEIGYRDGAFRAFKGAISGSNLELFLHELVRRVEDIGRFDELPIPFRAIATDMVTGGEVVFDRGPVYKAMRASMSVPGMFTPAEIDGRMLGDGGLVNNLPVDVVKAMGADIVIAVNIGTPLMSRSQLSSIVGLASQSINILTEQNVRERLKLLGPADILISPDLGDLTFVDFEAGPKFIAAGAVAARAVSARLQALSMSVAEYTAFQASLLRTVDAPPKTLDFVRIEGTEYANPAVLAEQMATQPDKPFDIAVLHNDLARIYGRGDFEQVDYRLIEENNKSGLVVEVKEKSWGPSYFRFGMTLASDLKGETSFDVLVGHKRSWVNSLGAEWINEVTLGRSRAYRTEFYQPLSTGHWLFASAYGQTQRAPEFVFGDGLRIAEYDVLTNVAGADIGAPLGRFGELRAGYKYAHYRGDPVIAIAGFPKVTNTESGARILLRWDSFDQPYFAHRGVRGEGELFIGERQQKLGDEDFGRGNGSRASVDLTVALPLSTKDTLWVGGSLGAVKRERSEVISAFPLGGFLNLSGLRTGEVEGNYKALGRIVYLRRLGSLPVIGRDFYAGASLEAGNVWDERATITLGSLIKAGSLFVAADTWLGPFYFAWGHTTSGQSSFYLYLGRP